MDGRVAVMIVNGGALIGALGDDGIVEGQGLAVPHDGVASRRSALDRDLAAFVRQGIGGGILVAGQLHAAHVNVGIVRAGVPSLLGNAVEVLGAGDAAGNLFLLGKRRICDFHGVVRVSARSHRDLLVLRRGDGDCAHEAAYRLRGPLRRHFAAGDGEAMEGDVDAVAVCVLA